MDWAPSNFCGKPERGWLNPEGPLDKSSHAQTFSSIYLFCRLRLLTEWNTWIQISRGMKRSGASLLRSESKCSAILYEFLRPWYLELFKNVRSTKSIKVIARGVLWRGVCCRTQTVASYTPGSEPRRRRPSLTDEIILWECFKKTGWLYWKSLRSRSRRSSRKSVLPNFGG